MITQTITTSFKQNMFAGVQNLTTDTIRMALYTATADLDENTTVYVATYEVSGANYTVFVSFDNVTWTNVSFTCRGALIYNQTQGNKSIAVLNFGSDKLAGPNFTVILPANSPTTALIRI